MESYHAEQNANSGPCLNAINPVTLDFSAKPLKLHQIKTNHTHIGAQEVLKTYQIAQK